MIIGVRWFLPESVRFLLSKGKTEEAGKIVEDLARKAGRTNLELFLRSEIKGQVKLNFVQQLAMLRSVWAPMVVLALVYFCFFIQTWGINAWLPTIFVRQGFTLAKSFNYTLIILCVTPFSHLIAMWLQERINRKWAMLLHDHGGDGAVRHVRTFIPVQVADPGDCDARNCCRPWRCRA